MKALILAAGFGTRLKTLGETIPKGLIRHGQTPLIDYLLREVGDIPEIKQIALVSNNRYARAYEVWLKRHQLDIQLLNNGVDESDMRLGALGDLIFGIDQLQWQTQPILVLPSDTYFRFPLAGVIRKFRETGEFTTVLRQMPDKSVIANRLGCAVLNEDRIIEFAEKPSQPRSLYAAIPFYIYPPKVVSLLDTYRKQGNTLDAPGSIINWLIENRHPVHAYVTEYETLDVGTPADVTQLQSF